MSKATWGDAPPYDANDARLDRFAKAICNAYGGAGCVMDTDPDRPKCNGKNCAIYPRAVKLLAQLDAYYLFKRDKP